MSQSNARNISSKTKVNKPDVTFRSSKNIPFQRWYPYAEGYSTDFVRVLIEENKFTKGYIYEPFAGTGTTIFASDSKGFNTIYSEINPVLRYLIDVKINILSLSNKERLQLCQSLSEYENIFVSCSLYPKNSELEKAYKLVFGNSIYFSSENFEAILRLKTYIESIENDLIKRILHIAVFSCLIPASYLKKQGDLRFKTPKERLKDKTDFKELLQEKLTIIREDICSNIRLNNKHSLAIENAKEISEVSDKYEISGIITSPPYLNGTNYIRNTKLELWYLGCLKTENDLRKYRDAILTSGINDVILTNKIDTSFVTKSQLLCSTIEALKNNAYDNRIPVMALHYFFEMYTVFSDVRRLLTDNAVILLDLGDSIFNNIHIKTDKILIELFQEMGYIFEKEILLRERKSRNGGTLSQVLLKFKYHKNEQ